MKKCFLFAALFLLLNKATLHAQDPDSTKLSSWSVHFQLTVISQSHSGFNAKYSGTNSLADSVEIAATSVTSTLFFGKRLWKGACLFANPELSGGRGLSYSEGVAGALNGETYRIGDPAPVLALARAYLQQYIPIGKSAEQEYVADGQNLVAGKIPSSRIAITLGKFSMSDFYDKNSFSHDPRSQFINWSLMSNGAWDYPANTKGYTFGALVELIRPGYAIRVSSVAVPVIANHSVMEYVFGKAHSETAEFEKKLAINTRPGAIRLLFSYTASRAPSYQQGMQALKDNDTTLLNVISGNAKGSAYGGRKTGIGLNYEQELADNISLFSRLGWNDGLHATWAFTEIDQTAQLGLSFKGIKWKRNDDAAGVAVVVNGISSEHRAFLKAGGYGFIIGDGNLNYGHEAILETYYNCKIYNNIWITGDYQFVNNPGYNKDRGPVHVFSVRGHFEF